MIAQMPYKCKQKREKKKFLECQNREIRTEGS